MMFVLPHFIFHYCLFQVAGQGLGIMIIEGKHAEVGQGIFISDIQEGSAAEQVIFQRYIIFLQVLRVSWNNCSFEGRSLSIQNQLRWDLPYELWFLVYAVKGDGSKWCLDLEFILRRCKVDVLNTCGRGRGEKKFAVYHQNYFYFSLPHEEKPQVSCTYRGKKNVELMS